MTSQQILQSDVLDILFEGRNKSYGAYSLRKNYPKQLLKAIGITLSLVSILLLFSGSSTPARVAPEKEDSFKLSPVVLPAPMKPEPVRPVVKQPTAASRPVQTEVLLENMRTVEQTRTAIVTQDDLLTATVGSTQVAGPVSTGIPVPPDPGVGNGTSGGSKPNVTEEPPLPSRAPQFPGGTQAWLNFLGRHLRPPHDMEPGEKRSCQIQFSVDEEGSITNFQVVQSGGEAFDNEVIRVLKKMPRWLPAIQNGKATAVSFTQPVTFIAQEE